MGKPLDKLVIAAHADQVVYHVSRNPATMEAREKH